MDMDELFGDGANLSRPPSKELHSRVDELRRGGCCQAIAWSNWGCIATIAADKAALELRNLRCHPENGTWGLSEPSTTPPFTQTMDGGPLKHLCWSPTGSDLAVIDSAGRITIVSLFSSLNKPAIHRTSQFDPADDLCGVVGCYWLNLAPYHISRPAFLNGPAVKEGSSYRYDAAQCPVLGPFHPTHGKSAFVCVTTNGLLRVLYPQTTTGKYQEVHTELESVVSSDDLITHAAICPDKSNTLLIAFATTSKQLRTVRALIDWGQQKTNEKGPSAPQPLNPSIKTRHVAVTSWLFDSPGESLNVSSLDSSMVQLSHLEFLPPCADASGRISPATIVAVRSHMPVSMSHYNQDVHTVVDRWEIREKPQTLHPAFEHLSSRRNSVGGSQPGPTVYLKKLECFTVNKIALAMQPINLGKVIFFAYSDSSVEYRDRASMAEIWTDPDLDRVWHLSQIGFSYTEDEPCLQVALSPSYCSLVQIRNDGKVKWKELEYHLGDIGSSMDDAQYSAVIAALALSCSTSVMRNVTYDDLLATAHKYAKPNFAYDWLVELSRILKAPVDYSEEQHFDVLIRNTTIQLCLCIQNSLGFRGEFNPRTFPGKFAWLVLQLRNIVVLVTMAANLSVPGGPNPNDKTSPLEDPEVINALAGSVRWILDLMAWLTDTLLTFPTTLPPNMDLKRIDGFTLPDLLSHLRATNTISLHLLLSSPTRGFLTAICRRLSHLDYIARRAMSYSSGPQNGKDPSTPQPANSISPDLRNAYLQIATLTTNTILRIKTIETLLGSLTALIKEAYKSCNPPLSGQIAERARNTLEIKMLFGGQFPDAFKMVIVELFKREGLLENVRDDIEPAKLFFADFTLLEVDEDAVSVARRKNAGLTMDCFRKAWLENPKKKLQHADSKDAEKDGANGGNANGRQVARWRRCARCAAVMEDMLSERRALQWLIMQQRRCFCSGYWDTLNPGQTVA
ncbi:mediator of RNA polymerase-like protein II transcription subunit 16 [Tricladium varicosporioides]|nr:mediator of RNA polymerase-like protein II transcription subunit 16 [Hymenoscyphus varicosporioides]